MLPIDAPDMTEWVRRATGGDSAALEALCDSVRDDIYGVAMRMLGHPADAEDATQEILILIVTHLGSFEGRSSFRTWAWRIATHHLLRAGRGRRENVDFEGIARVLDLQKVEPVAAAAEPPSAEQAVLLREVKLGCTQAMLLALDRDHRLAFILCEILELPGDDAAAVLEIDPAALRKRVSRARSRIAEFMRGRCGWVGEGNPCRCSRQLPIAVRTGHLDPHQPVYACHPERQRDRVAPAAADAEVDELRRTVNVFRSHPDYAAPVALRQKLSSLIRGGTYRVLDG
jgi:RNA polymerase sigma factor (sigma-70 family)